MKILLHICCAPCAVYPFLKLKEEFEEVMGFWYNPNIHPLLEYRRRLEAVKIWAEREKVKVIYKDEYDLKGFLRRVVYRESQRCFFCYQMRLEKTAIFGWKKSMELSRKMKLYHQQYCGCIYSEEERYL